MSLPKRLTDLKPRWWYAGDGRRGMGVNFWCPHCADVDLPTLLAQLAKSNTSFHIISIAFENPLDGGPPAPGRLHWKRTGDTFETLTLAPSVDASRTHPQGWHGFVINGEVR